MISWTVVDIILQHKIGQCVECLGANQRLPVHQKSRYCRDPEFIRAGPIGVNGFLKGSGCNHIASFRGISGGPMLDMAGTVIGTQVGSLPRRGRIVTSAPANVNAMMKANRLEEESTGASNSGIEDLDAEHYARAGEKLRAQGRVVLVFCDVKEDKGLMILN